MSDFREFCQQNDVVNLITTSAAYENEDTEGAKVLRLFETMTNRHGSLPQAISSIVLLTTGGFPGPKCDGRCRFAGGSSIKFRTVAEDRGCVMRDRLRSVCLSDFAVHQARKSPVVAYKT